MTQFLADFYPKTAKRPAQVDIHQVTGGHRVAHRTFDVTGKAEARRFAAEYGATCNNF